MEPNPEIADEDWARAEQWEWIDGTIVLVGLLLFQASLFKSGYSVEVITELQERLNRLIKNYTKKGQ